MFQCVFLLFVLVWITGCVLACDPGYYGTDCTRLCDARCLNCSDGVSCDSCPDGMHGSLCQGICPRNCAKCSQLTSTCLECLPGFYGTGGNCANMCDTGCSICKSYTECYLCTSIGDDCQEICGPNCNCNGSDRCISCKAGYSGSSCSLQCSVGCLDGTCQQGTGHCTCKDGFTDDNCVNCDIGLYGTHCNYNCKHYCYQCELQSTLYKCLSCKHGHYGSDCDKNCSAGCHSLSCDRWTGTCASSCKTGYYGAWCCPPGTDGEDCQPTPATSTPCPDNCDSCTIHTECTVCKTGFYGPTCNLQCPENCDTMGCEQTVGTCSACVVGYHGNTCNMTCRENCDETGCHQMTGLCNGCDTGFFTTACNEFCPANCANNNCSMIGNCIGCDAGFYGDSCANYCPPNCLNNVCIRDGKCSACDTGYYTQYCNVTCPNKCNDGICEMISGNCNQGCVAGYSGDNCNSTCDINCSSCSQNEKTVCETCKPDKYGLTNNILTFAHQCSLNCKNNSCNDRNGACSQGCTAGHWDLMCDKTCHIGCMGYVCDQFTGNCVSCTDGYVKPNCVSCIPGYYYDTMGSCVKCSGGCEKKNCNELGHCVNGCIQSYYGVKCLAQCDTHCVGQQCNAMTGACLSGCVDGYIAATVGCVEEENTGSTADSQVAVIGGAAGGGAAVLIIITIVIVCLVRRRGKGGKSSEDNVETNGEVSNIVDEQVGPVYAVVNKPRTGANTDTKPPVTTTTTVTNRAFQRPPSTRVSTAEPILEIDDDDKPINQNIQRESNVGTSKDTIYYNTVRISVSKLAEFVASRDSKFFKSEFMSFPYGLKKEYKVSQAKDNLRKNRYRGIYPYDDSRVKVSGGDTDYINASFIDGFRKKNAYIASLGPTVKQMEDFSVFWRMVWQHRVEKIIMLTNLVEEGKPKCDLYWPTIGTTRTYSGITVTCHSDDAYADFNLRAFTLTKGKEKRSIHQLHFTAWPDRGVPEDVTGLVEVRQKDLGITAKLDGPVLVHCSAGIGRTGTYIGLDILTKEGETEKTVDIPQCVRRMRQNRTNMVQTPEQYQFLYEAVVHSLTFNSKPVQGEKFQAYVSSLSKDLFRDQFTKLQTTLEKVSEEESQAVKRNSMVVGKNRENANVPGDANRPRLYLSLKPGSTDYINAVYINSFKQRRRYLVTQSPLPTTVLDFLTLVIQEQCSCIVSFESGSEQGIGEYYPADNQQLRKGIYTVTCANVESHKTFVQRKLKVVHRSLQDQSTQTRLIPHLQYTDWDANKNAPRSASAFVQFINRIEKESKEYTDDGPILVHCLDGGGKSGLLCVVSVLLQKMEIEHEVSVVNTVRQVKARRHNAVCNEDQLEFCHTCVSEYLRSFDIYSNFA